MVFDLGLMDDGLDKIFSERCITGKGGEGLSWFIQMDRERSHVILARKISKHFKNKLGIHTIPRFHTLLTHTSTSSDGV